MLAFKLAPIRLVGGFIAALTIAATLLLASAAKAPAADSFPCGSPQPISWSSEPVQPCALSAPLPPNGWVPVYSTPVPNPRGSTPPKPAGWLHGTTNQYFVCQQAFTNAVYYHPSGWRNYWWSYTLSDDNVWGWVPEVFFRGGLDDEPDGRLRACPTTVAPAPPPPPPPGPPAPGPPAPGVQTCVRSAGAATLGLSAGVVGSGRSVTTRFGQEARVVGTLSDPHGNQVVGATLCVEQIDPSAGALRRTGSTTTDGHGHFVYVLKPRSSRRVWFIHSGTDGTAATSVAIKVRAPIGLEAWPDHLRNGQTVDLKGRVGGGSISRGALVEMQAKRGYRWQTFGTTNVHAHGRFIFHYTFARTYELQHYSLRARVPQQRGYPFAPGTSRPVLVTVHG